MSSSGDKVTAQSAILALADGTVYEGESIGAAGQYVGEVVFNTAMSGYQEILSDPSYCKQIITFTCPHIGNVGTNPDDDEAPGAFAGGLVVRDAPMRSSNWRARRSLRDYLVEKNLIGIAGVDTRKLTRDLRERGAQAGCIAAGPDIDAMAAVAAAGAFAGLAGMDLAAEVSTAERYTWEEGVFELAGAGSGHAPPERNTGRYRVVAYDFGIKRNILRLLADRGCTVTVVPARTPAAEVLELAPDGIFLSNGPGDPEPCDYAVASIRTFLERELPVFGICLGHQLLGLAAGARTMKMKFGHHGANHPVQELASGRVMITSQNHGFAVDEDSLPDSVRTTHRSLFDGSLQGIEIEGRPAFGFQGHPEASPGPHDVVHLFDRFTELMAARA